MNSPKSNLLIAMDLSVHSCNAVRYVTRNCSPAMVKVRLMHVMPTAPEIFWDLEKEAFFKEQMKGKYAKWKREAKKEAQAFLDDARNILLKAQVGKDSVDVMVQERKKGIARDIIEEAKKGYDAVLVGRRGLSKLEDVFLGSVSNKIVEKVSNVPVWVVGGDIQSRKMLIAVDASDNSRKAVDYVGTFAAATEAELTLYHVIRSLGIGILEDFPRSKEEIKVFDEVLASHAQDMFQAYQESLEKAGVVPARILTKYTRQSHTRAGEILREAKDGDYGTIVMGRRGLSKVHEFLMGRVTNKVLSRAEGFALWLVP